MKQAILNLLKKVADGLSLEDAEKDLENFTFWSNGEALSDLEQEEIGRLVSEGFTSGQCAGENSSSIAWQLNWNKWEN